jgi:PAS domain S-box-containing protein
MAVLSENHASSGSGGRHAGFPLHGGEMGARIRQLDWSRTLLGPVQHWPASLKAAVSFMLPADVQIVLFWGPEFIALYNDAYAPTIGDKHPKALGRPARENWSELWDDLEPLLMQVLSTGETVTAKDRPFYIERHGYPETVYFDISYSPIHDDSGAVGGVLCIVNETTDRVLAERALAKSEERLSLALSAAGTVGIFDTDLRSGKVYADSRFASMFSLTPERAEAGATLSDYLANIHPEDVGWVGEAIQEAVATGKKCILEYRVIGDDRAVRWLEVHGQCLYDEMGNPWRMPGVAVDITQRKKIELSAGSLAAIVASSEDAIIGMDLNGVITAWNRGAEKLYDYTPQEVIGRSVTILLPDDRNDEELEILERVGRGEHVGHYETVRRRKDGGLVDISLTVSPVSDTQGKIVGASKIARDISRRRDTERLQRTLMHEMKHRMQNTLATVMAIARQSFRGLEGGRTANEAFEARLLALSKGHDLLTSETWESVALHDLIAQPVSAYGAERFEIDGPSLRLPPRSALALTLVLHELSTNAAKYGALSVPSGGVAITWQIEHIHSPRFSLRWQEKGGPPVSAPTKRGFGSRLIENALSTEAGSETRIVYHPAGLVCEIIVPLSAEWDDGSSIDDPLPRTG